MARNTGCPLSAKLSITLSAILSHLRLVHQSQFRTISSLIQVPKMTIVPARICQHNSQLYTRINSSHMFLSVVQMSSYRCRRTDVVVQMSSYRCRRTDVVVQMSSYRCRRTDVVVQMSSYRCRRTDVVVQCRRTMSSYNVGRTMILPLN